MPDSKNLDGSQVETLSRLFRHPVSHNIEWHDLLSLLKKLGTVEESNSGRYHVTIGSESVVLEAPRDKDVDMSTVLELRNALRKSGLGPRS